MEATKLVYMDDSYLFEYESTILGVEKLEDGRSVVFTDETIFYPQGGGQPYDTGMMSKGEVQFRVEEVRFYDGVVHHIGVFSGGEFTSGDKVAQAIDQEKRVLHSKLQSGGHLIDMAMRAIGYSNLKPTKGFHFPEGPNVEYEGTIPEDKREEVLPMLQEKLNEMITTGYEVKTQFATKEELPTLCYITPEHIPEGKPVRIVSVWNDEFMPCGATHVKNISELSRMTIRKIKCKGGDTKISYSVV